MNELGLCSYWPLKSRMRVPSGEYPELVCIASLNCGCGSRVLVVDIAVEESHDDVEHWTAEAHLIAGLAAEHPDPFGFHSSFVILARLCLQLLLDPFLQLEGRLLPIACWSRRIGG